jgi:hypothetical protein
MGVTFEHDCGLAAPREGCPNGESNHACPDNHCINIRHACFLA